MDGKKHSKNITNFIMKFWPAYPIQDDENLREVFSQNEYLPGSKEYKNK